MKFSWGIFKHWKGYVKYQIAVVTFIPIVLAHMAQKMSMSASSLNINTSFSSFAERARKHINWAWPQSRVRVLSPASYLPPAFHCTSVTRYHPSLTWSLWTLWCSLPFPSKGDTCRGQRFGSASHLSAFILHQVLSTSLGPEPLYLDFSQLVEPTWCHYLLSR